MTTTLASDLLTPLGAYLRLRESARGAFLLESVERGRLGRYSFAGSGSRIVYLNETVDSGYATVRSRIVTRRPAEIAVDYRLMLRDGRWRAHDVLVDGVSFVATFRSEFDRIIQQSSYGGLVDKLRKRAVQTTAMDKSVGGS